MTTGTATLIVAIAAIVALALYVGIDLFLDWVLPTAAQERAKADAEALISAANQEFAQRPRLQFTPTPFHLEQHP